MKQLCPDDDWPEPQQATEHVESGITMYFDFAGKTNETYALNIIR